MRSWTRTLNLDDAHTLLALAEPGLTVDEWGEACMDSLPSLSHPRRRELVRILRDAFLTVDDRHRLVADLFLRTYHRSPAIAQIEMVQVQWALTHPLSLIAVKELIAPSLRVEEPDIPLEDVEALVTRHLETSSQESRRKTRTVLLGALDGVGVLVTRGTGQHRSLRAARGAPHPATWAWLIRRDLAERGADAMLRAEALESALPSQLTCCPVEHAATCLDAAIQAGHLHVVGDEVRAPQAQESP